MEMVADRASFETLSELLKDVRVAGKGMQRGGGGAGLVMPAKQPPPPPLTATDIDIDNDGRVSRSELAATVVASKRWVEVEQRAALSAALFLLAQDPELAVEMVIDGASPAVMNRLAQESGNQQAKEGSITQKADDVVAGESMGSAEGDRDLPVALATDRYIHVDPALEREAYLRGVEAQLESFDALADGAPLTINGRLANVAADGTVTVDALPPPPPPPSVLTVGSMDSNHNGHVSSQELSSAIAGSVGVWDEAAKLEVGAAAILLHEADPDLAAEMVADGAGAEMMRHLAEESAALQSAPRRPKEPPEAAAANPPPPRP